MKHKILHNKSYILWEMIFLFVLLFFSSLFAFHMLAQTTTTEIPVCAYQTSDWSACSSSGIQTRTYTAVPTSGCTPDPQNIPSTSRSCTATIVACSYSYSSWSACSSSGKQTRTVTSYSPTGCNPSAVPILEQSCTYTPTSSTASTSTSLSTTRSSSTSGTDNTTSTTNCSYNYTSWSTCSASGKQTRTVASLTPAGCRPTTIPVLEQSCSPTLSNTTSSGTTTRSLSTGVVCAYQTSDWSACSSSGIQTRTITKNPTGCYDDPNPDNIPKNYRSCTYSPATSNNISTVNNTGASSTTTRNSSANGLIIICSYQTSDWSACNNRIQTRTITKSPIGCYDDPDPENIPKTNRACNDDFVASTTLNTDPTDNATATLLPAQLSGLIATENNGTLNYNGQTSSDWQKKYFGSPDCQDAKNCGGAADPDNDDLSNNDEYRYGTDPNKSDTDGDGYSDGDEVKNGFDPLKSSPGDKSDKITYESPKTTGETNKQLYKVEDVISARTEKNENGIMIKGTGLPNSIVNIYIYSELPIILAIKTDQNGSWSYTLDKNLEDGEHQVYVAVTDNAGKITAKSEPLFFVKSAEAVSVIPPAEAMSSSQAISPIESQRTRYMLISLFIATFTIVLALIAIGIRVSVHRKKDDPFSGSM